MHGTVVKVAVSDGQQVQAGDVIAVLEAMKMEQPIGAHKTGTVSRLAVAVGDTVSHGAHVCDIA
jgi:acetyl-CoA/propionyl-CoA carboxylase biotin carboxyl carrier protein